MANGAREIQGPEAAHEDRLRVPEQFLPMSLPTDSFLKLHHPGANCVFEQSAARNVPGLTDLNQAFATVTGWSLAYEESRTSLQRRIQSNCVDLPIHGALVIEDLAESVSPSKTAVDRRACEKLVSCLNRVLTAVDEGREDNWLLQSDLAATVPVALGTDREKLALQLSKLLSRAADLCDVQSVLLYILDDRSDSLMLRARHGYSSSLPGRRQLNQAHLDMRALSEGSVVLDHATQYQFANLPANCQSAICVAIPADTAANGTLWLLSNERKKFDQRAIVAAHTVADAIALTLEKASLTRELAARKHNTLKFPSVVSATEDSSGSRTAQLDRISLTAITRQGRGEALNASAWWVGPRDDIAAGLIRIEQSSTPVTETRLVAVTSFRCLAQTASTPREIVASADHIIRCSVPGEADISIVAARFDPLTGEYVLDGSGQMRAIHIRSGGADEIRFNARSCEIGSNRDLVGRLGTAEHLLFAGESPQLLKSINLILADRFTPPSHNECVQILETILAETDSDDQIELLLVSRA